MIQPSAVSVVRTMLYVGKGMRVDDLKVYLPAFSDEDIGAALAALVEAGEAESYDVGGQTFYLLADK